MQFSEIIGQHAVKEKLLRTVNEKRVAHTQLFLGHEGAGALSLALAYAQYLNCTNKQGNDSCGVCHNCLKFQKFTHPDLFFLFPTATNKKVTKNPQSSLFQEEWLQYLIETGGYVKQNEWFDRLGIGNKQGAIHARDANELIKWLSFKPYEAQYKVAILFQAERLHPAASNKLLKSLEEPPENTLIILIAERYELIIPTVRSRAQLVKIPPLTKNDIQHALLQKYSSDIDEKRVNDIALQAKGNWNQALYLREQSDESEYNFVSFRKWMRLCFIGNNYIAINELIQEFSHLGREKQKSFLQYGMEMIHYTLLVNENREGQIQISSEEKDYLKKFAPYVNEANRREMYDLFNEAVYHIERNAHPSLLFMHLSFRFSQLLRQGQKLLTKT